MCLKVRKDAKIEIAKEDITCYKVLEIRKGADGKERYQTPYQSTLVEFSEYGTALLESFSDGTCPYEILCSVVEGGASYKNDDKYLSYGLIHSYIDSIVAMSCVNTLTAHYEYYRYETNRFGFTCQYKFYRCIIPKGTEYILSDDGKQVGSRRVIIYKE